MESDIPGIGTDESRALLQHVPAPRSKPRSRNGCWTCRGKAAKKRCDERRPICGRCARLGLFCDYRPRPRKSKASRSSPSPSLTPRQPNPISPAASLAPPTDAPCSLSLAQVDHEAIRYFRTAFASLHHTKHQEYSCISIMFTLAQEDPMVMHMALALSFGDMDLKRPNPSPKCSQRPTYHYSSALRLLADAVGREEPCEDFDSLLTTLWLMILYEQQFGHSQSQGCTNHIKGAASLLQHRMNKLLRFPTSDQDVDAPAYALTRRSGSGTRPMLSLYSARMLVWISGSDAAAASTGGGGHFNRTLMSLLSETQQEDSGANLNDPFGPPPLSPLQSYMRMHRYSNPLYRVAWGHTYPQAELLDDLQNRNIYNLLTVCNLLRFMVAELASIPDISSNEFQQQAASVSAAIRNANYTYAELLEVSRELCTETDHSQRLVANIRYIVPIFYGIQLEFLRITQPNSPLGQGKRQRLILAEIMRLAFQLRSHWGDDGLRKIAWPLFLAGLETDDLLHREWILERFQKMSEMGEHLKRAFNFLKDALVIQQGSGRRVDIREMMKGYPIFVLG
ncbi:hypothetical protein NCS57_00944600 [Fusarium keratoplasticum]|uniref:Uncharacterized protein n=1 Tax=Fusarium keratoplasticum TaxID=1328300 RepID=A0ACC0QQ14_9HYPO|nr:hypothetical protein NCS57_00944600 [Fusarium keratoplasticum]KAI8663438.1 hypothetical protein NCS57_00944600 [Fusarium keratoplasticum]